MKIVVTLLAAAFLIWLVFNRQRIYVHDPLAAVYRNDIKQSGVEVDFNFSNDVLLQPGGNSSGPRIILQHWNLMPGTPASLICLRWIVCLTPADHAPVLAPNFAGKQTYNPHVSMQGRHITFVDPSGAQMRIDL